MSTIYQRCPFCEQVFGIGPDEYEPMELHIRVALTEEQRGEAIDASIVGSSR
jgi:hypothetical protein